MQENIIFKHLFSSFFLITGFPQSQVCCCWWWSLKITFFSLIGHLKVYFIFVKRIILSLIGHLKKKLPYCMFSKWALCSVFIIAGDWWINLPKVPASLPTLTSLVLHEYHSSLPFTSKALSCKLHKILEIKTFESCVSKVSLTRKVFLPVILNFFGKNTVNRIHFELIPGKNSAAKYVQKSCKKI